MSELRRAMTLWSTSLYGIGTVIGAGIYVLIGKVAEHAGYFSPWAFLIAGMIAACTGISYAEFSSRYPKTAGSALYIEKAWNNHLFTQIVAVSVGLTGIISAAAIANGIVGYLNIFFDISRPIAIISMISLLTLVSCIGIKLSSLIIGTITILEVTGLIVICFLAFNSDPIIASNINFTLPTMDDISGISFAVILAFYAFIGFEDMVNMAEEVKDPSRTLPKAIIISVIFCVILYMLISFAALRAVPLETLSNSEAPLALIVEKYGYSPLIISGIGIFAVLNGALVQILMASRLLLGMANMNKAPRIFSEVHPITKTPIYSTVLVGMVILAFALWFPISTLASLTSYIMLLVFIVVNISLIRIKSFLRIKTSKWEFPIIFPALGIILSLGLLLFQAANLIS
jgi:basic amino acid/polyamine antiporter, APA family